MLTEADLDALEAKALDVKRCADAIMDTDDYRASYSLVLHELAQLGEEMPEVADAVLALSAEVRRLRAVREPREGGGLSASTLDALDDSATEAWGFAREWGQGAPTPLEWLSVSVEVRRLRARVAELDGR